MALVKYNNNSISAVTSTALSSGALVPIKTLTASSSSTLSFVDGSSDVVLDSTYPIYVFKFINIHPQTDQVFFQFQANASGGSGYNETITSTYFRAIHLESDAEALLDYQTGSDLAQSTSFQRLTQELSNDNDGSVSGELFLFNPSSTTFVKHFMATTQSMHHDPQSVQSMVAGYFNTTSAVDEIQFKMSSGNIDAGTIKLYGIKDS
tara:strand:- start:159 stop:779 length:621 start_codon:yes stop_codon:yes gene_type:complete